MNVRSSVMKGFLSLKSFFMMFVVLVGVVALVPELNNQFQVAQDNSTGAAATFWGLGPLVIAAMIIIAIVGYIKTR